MPSKKLSRTTYRDPTLPGNPVRSGDSTRAENAADMDDYFRPLAEVHGCGLHAWGVADGLHVRACHNQPDLIVEPGIGLNVAGRVISLAEGGNAEIGTNDLPTPATPVGVTQHAWCGGNTVGARIPTAGLGGTKYVTIQWWEAFDTDAYNTYGVYRFNHTPWIRLLDAAGFVDNGDRVVLARVTLSPTGQVTGLTQQLRRVVGLPVERIRVQRGEMVSGSPNFEVGTGEAGELGPRTGGGLEVVVPGAGDHVEFRRDGGNFAKMSIAAQQIVARRSNGKETVVIDTTNGMITAGTQGVDGDIHVRDNHDRLVFAVNGYNASVHVGTNGNEGDILVRDNANANSIRLDGASGDVWFRGSLRDVNNSHHGITHRQLRDLTDGGITNLHRHVLGIIGRNGETGTQLGIVGGWVRLKAQSIPYFDAGTVTIPFNSRNWTSTPAPPNELVNRVDIFGYQGNFSATPHYIIAPRGLVLSTKDDTFFRISVQRITPQEVTFSFNIDLVWGLDQSFYYLIIGPT